MLNCPKQTKQDDERWRNPKAVTHFPKWNTSIKLLLHAVLTMLSITSLLYSICFNDLCRPIEHTSMLAKKHPFACCPAAKNQNAADLRVTDIREKPADFFRAPHERQF